jgi:hypothetical protein
MPPPEFWFDLGDSGGVAMHAPGIAVVFGGEHGIGHTLCVDSGSGILGSGCQDWLVQSAVFSDKEIQEGQGRRIDNPVFQEVVPHGFSGDTGTGLVALLTGSCLNHHFSAVFSLYREPETAGCIILDVDVADRCRGPVEKLAATYVVGAKSFGAEPRHVSAQSIEWRSEDSHLGRIELVAIPFATVDLRASSSGDMHAQIQAKIDPASHTQRLRYRWRWTRSSELTR